MTDSSEPLVYKPDAKGWSDIERGEFGYRRREDGSVKWLFFWPRTSTAPLMAAVLPQRNGLGAGWTLTGTEERPTLQPSVNAEGIWHGFLTDGVATP